MQSGRSPFLPYQSSASRYLEIAAFFVALPAEQEPQPGQRQQEDEADEKVRMKRQQHRHHDGTQEPQPGRERGNDAPAIQEANGDQVEEIEKETGESQGTEQRIVGDCVQPPASDRPRGPQKWTPNANPSFHPRVLGGVLQRNQRTHERNEHRRPHLEADGPCNQEVSALVDKKQQHKTQGEHPTPGQGVGPNRKEHRAPGLQPTRKKLNDRDDQKLQLCRKLEYDQQRHPQSEQTVS